MYCHVLASRITGEPPACRGKPRFCEKNTVKRRKEGTMRENRAMVKRLGLRKPGEPQVSRNKLRWGSCSRNTTTNWSGHTHLGERSTLLCPKGACPDRPSDGAPCETPTLRYQLQRPSGPPDHHRGLHYHRIRGSGPLLLLLSLISYSKLASQHHPRIPASISGNLYSKRYFPVMGGSSPLSLPPSTSQAPSLEEHIAKGQEEKGK